MHFFSYPEIQKLAAINNRVWFSVAMVVLSIASFIQRDDKLSYPLLINQTKKNPLFQIRKIEPSLFRSSFKLQRLLW